MNVQGNELIRHNMVVFSNGEQALQVLPGIVDTIPEARLNLVSYTLCCVIDVACCVYSLYFLSMMVNSIVLEDTT